MPADQAGESRIVVSARVPGEEVTVRNVFVTSSARQHAEDSHHSLAGLLGHVATSFDWICLNHIYVSAGRATTTPDRRKLRRALAGAF
jgi:hypothetical protein